MWVNLRDFFPVAAGVQQKSPGGVEFDLADVTAVVSSGEPYGYIDIFVRGGKEPIRVTFHRNVDGGPAPIYTIAENIRNARKDLEYRPKPPQEVS